MSIVSLQKKEAKHYIGTRLPNRYFHKWLNGKGSWYLPFWWVDDLLNGFLFHIITHIPYWLRFCVWSESEFWKHIPPNEPFRVLLGDMRDKLYNTRERMRQMLATGKSDIPVEDTFTDASQVFTLSTDCFFLGQICTQDLVIADPRCTQIG